MRRLKIETEFECWLADLRIAELAGCLEHTEEEQELRSLIEAVDRWKMRWAHKMEQPCS